MDLPRHRIKPGARVVLQDLDPASTDPFHDRESAQSQLQQDLERLTRLQGLLYAENRRAVLVVLQGMDAAGKDGTVRHVFAGVDPTGCQVHCFKAPSEEEADHDFLWRVHRAVPRFGNIGIFNRSHYEDVLITRVHGWISRDECERRYEQINLFERLLVENGTRLVKLFLHISKEEQRSRLEARLRDPAKVWKFDPSDLNERRRWSEYQEAYQELLSRCSTPAAPWIVVPSDRKWYRNLVVARTLVEALEELDPRPPRPRFDPATIRLD